MPRDDDFEALLAEYDRRKDPQVGERVTGTVVSIGREHVFVDLGAKTEGSLELEQVLDEHGKPFVEVGQTIEATVVRKDDRSGALVLRSRLTRMHRSLEDLQQAFQGELPVEGLVTGTNKGGVEVQLGGLRGFCPFSQLDTRFVENAEELIGQRFAFRITKLEGGKRPDIVLSRRAVLEAEQRARAAVTRGKLEVGAHLQGTVTRIEPYGAFVDLGGIEGMVHISELGFGHVEHPKDALAVGQSVEAVVLEIKKTDDKRRPEKIALSIRALAKDPWEDVEERFPLGSRAHGKVVRLMPFGAFVELAPGVEGLCHISELPEGEDGPKVGEEYEFRILKVSPNERRISLSLRSELDRKAAQSYAGPRGGATLEEILTAKLQNTGTGKS
jgi:small subunit ribosomal protein S1